MSEQTPEVAAYNANIEILASLQQAAEEKYDTILTTLGSAFLALSVTFLKDVVPLDKAQWMWLLYLSWASFAATTMVTVVSLGMSSHAISWHVQRLSPTEFAPRGMEKQNPWNKAIQRLNLVAGAAFLLGVLCTVVFAVSNTVHWRTNMAKLNPETVKKGLTVPALQTGTTKPATPSTPSPAPQAPSPTPTQNSGNGSK